MLGKIFIVVGTVLFVVSSIVEFKFGISNSQAQLLAGGLFLLGIGEWNNERKENSIIPPNIYLGGKALLVTKTKWSPTCLGIIFDVIGLALLFLAVNSIMNYPFYHPQAIPTNTPTVAPTQITTPTP
jgi:hypothetical protein